MSVPIVDFPGRKRTFAERWESASTFGRALLATSIPEWACFDYPCKRIGHSHGKRHADEMAHRRLLVAAAERYGEA